MVELRMDNILKIIYDKLVVVMLVLKEIRLWEIIFKIEGIGWKKG